MTGEGYPHLFSANNSKSEFIARGLKECGCSVSIVDGAFGTKGLVNETSGTSNNGINYHTFCRKGRLKSFFLNLPKLWHVLKKEHRKDEINHIIIGMDRVPFLYIYFFMAWILGYSRSCLFHEWHIGFKNTSYLAKIEAQIRDKTFGYFLNSIYPIGHFLQEKCNRFHKPTMLIPVLAEYNDSSNSYNVSNHFAYCCAGEYLIRNTLILDSFKKLLEDTKYRSTQLILILQGNERVLEKAANLVKSYGLEENIVIKSKLPRRTLDNIFATAIGLLIPLDPGSLQDKARFSQKIAEYVATKRPIITSDVGEIPFYFNNKENAIIAPYNIEGYREAMRFLIENKDVANSIGINGFNVGKKFFDYRVCGEKLKDFITNISHKS